MRTRIAFVVVAAAVILSYARVVGLIQGVTCEEYWSSWLNRDFLLISDVLPPEALLQLLIGGLVVYTLCFRRKDIWKFLATHQLPGRLSRTSIARIAEAYLTDNYSLQRKALKRIPSGTTTVLDVGCGGAVYLGALNSDIRRIGLDASLERLRLARHYCDETILRDVTSKGALESTQADVALCFEVIEHLLEEQGDKLLRDLEKFPTVILTTPREWFEVRRDGYERHQSFWPAEKLAKYGYKQVDSGRIPPSNIYVRWQAGVIVK